MSIGCLGLGLWLPALGPDGLLFEVDRLTDRAVEALRTEPLELLEALRTLDLGLRIETERRLVFEDVLLFDFDLVLAFVIWFVGPKPGLTGFRCPGRSREIKPSRVAQSPTFSAIKAQQVGQEAW
jgi:hypothetical protein